MYFFVSSTCPCSPLLGCDGCYWASSFWCSEMPGTICPVTRCQKTWIFSNTVVRTSDVESLKVIYASSLMSSHSYRVFLLLLHQAQQLYHTDSLYVTAAVLRTVTKETHNASRCDMILLLYSVQPTALGRKEHQMCHQYTDWWHSWFISELCRDLTIVYSHQFWPTIELSICNDYLIQKLWNLHYSSMQVHH